MEEPHNTSIPRQEFLPTGGSSFHTAPLSRGFLSADQKSAFICNCLILSCYRILIPNHKIITYIAVSACAASDQLSMELFYPKEIAVAQKRQDVEQIMLLRELRIRTLCKMIPGGMMLPVIRLIHIKKPFRVFLCILPVTLSNFLKNLINQPHIPRPVQIKDLPKFCELLHKQVLHKVLQFLYRRMIRKRRIQRKDQQTSLDGVCMPVFLPAVIRQVDEPGIISFSGLLPYSEGFFLSITLQQPFDCLFTVWQLIDLYMVHIFYLVLKPLSCSAGIVFTSMRSIMT